MCSSEMSELYFFFCNHILAQEGWEKMNDFLRGKEGKNKTDTDYSKRPFSKAL